MQWPKMCRVRRGLVDLANCCIWVRFLINNNSEARYLPPPLLRSRGWHWQGTAQVAGRWCWWKGLWWRGRLWPPELSCPRSQDGRRNHRQGETDKFDMNLLTSDRVDIFENILWLKVSVELLLGRLKVQLLAILYIYNIKGGPRNRLHGRQPGCNIIRRAGRMMCTTDIVGGNF